MAIITITSDLGLKDYYASAIKGNIVSQLPNCTIIDITHSIEPFNILQASYIVKNAYLNFPEGTAHIISVNSHPHKNARYLGVYSAGHYFFSADNGIFSLILDKVPDKIVALTIGDGNFFSFPTKDILVPAACHVARGGTLEVIGKSIDKYLEAATYRPIADVNFIRGTIIYIDSYGNIISNITNALFNQIGKGRQFTIEVIRYNIASISNSYNEVDEGEIVAIFNSANYLELAINKGKMATLLNLKIGDSVTVSFQ